MAEERTLTPEQARHGRTFIEEHADEALGLGDRHDGREGASQAQDQRRKAQAH